MAEKQKFQFNGQTYTVKGRLCHDIVKYYVGQNPNATLATLQKAFNTPTHMIVATPEMALTVVNSDGKAGGDYYMKEADQIAIKKGKVVVWSYWPESYFKPFMEQVKALGYEVVQDGNEDNKKGPVAKSQSSEASVSPYEEVVNEIKEKMEENGLSVFYLFANDYYPDTLYSEMGNIVNELPDDYDFEPSDPCELFDYGQLEFAIGRNERYSGEESETYYIRKIDYRDGKLFFGVEELYENVDGGRERYNYFSDQSVEDMLESCQSIQNEYYNVKGALENIAKTYLDDPCYISVSRVVDYDPAENPDKSGQNKNTKNMITTMDIKDIKNALVYFSFTSKDGEKYAYVYLIFNRKFYWIDENYNVAQPLSQDTWNSYVEGCQQGDYDEMEYDLDSYDSLDEFLEEFGNGKKEGVIEEGYEYPEYLSENGEYVISVFVGAEKVCEKVI